MPKVIISLLVAFLTQVSYGQILVCSTIHGSHKDNNNYTYRDLCDFIDVYDPDIIALEIRQFDLDSSPDYLSKNYPFEMYSIKERYKHKVIVGFDWLGKELEGIHIPSNYWKNDSWVKKMELELNSDTIVQKKFQRLDSLQSLKLKIFLNESIIGLNDGRYDEINREFYTELEGILTNTKYSSLVNFYKERNRNIVNNLKNIIQKNRGKRILILTGADHRSYIMDDFFNSKFADEVIESDSMAKILKGVD